MMDSIKIKSNQITIGIDLGGTHLRVAMVNTETGEIISQIKMPTLAQEGYLAVIKRMADITKKVIAESGISFSNIVGIGIGVPGTPNLETGEILFLPNLPGQWRNIPLAKILGDQINLPVYLINDVRAMTMAEWRFGAGQNVQTMVCVAIGTGIGGGLVINNQLHLGLNGTAGELGHLIVESDGIPCGCGNRGCLEMYSSGPAIASMGVKFVLHGHTTLIGELVNYEIQRITAETIVQAARSEDQKALYILSVAGKYLGIAISNMLVAISPNKVVIGGGVAEAGNLLLDPVKQTILERVFMMPASQVDITTAQLGTQAGIIGSALWAADRISGG